MPAHGIFDAAFDRSAGDTRRKAGQRIGLYTAGMILCALPLGAPWALVLYLFGVAAEMVLLWTTSPKRRYRGPNTHRWMVIATSPFASSGWVGMCVVFWMHGGEVGRLVGMALLAGCLAYTVRALHRSPVLLAAASGTSVIAILALPLTRIAATGDYAALQAAAVLLVGFALASAVAAYREHLELVAASRALEDQTARAEAANEAKSEFLTNMSHEIRTPLNGVLGMAFAMGLDPALTAQQRERLEVINRSGRALLDLLNDLLDLAKIEAGRIELEDGVVDVEDLAREAESSFGALSAAKDIYLTIKVAPAARGHWRGDPVRVRQVLYNLVGNAVKFTSVGEVRVSVGVEDGRLVLTVADTGPGIAPENLEKLFEKFVQADSSITREYGGSGLGLSICRQLVELMGGSISVQSQVGEGSTFKVILPLARLAKPAKAPARRAVAAPVLAARNDVAGLRILAAEDNPTNQLVLSSLLKDVAGRLEITGNGKEALEAWRRGHWDVVLMDLQMPVMDGLAATRALRAEEEARGLARTPVLAVSANAMAHHIQTSAAAGLDGHVAKPVQPDVLLAAIASAVKSPAAGRRRTKAARARTA
jgi:signal transduction histidine kinase/AmiR/NasT family two-component response regulator